MSRDSESESSTVKKSNHNVLFYGGLILCNNVFIFKHVLNRHGQKIFYLGFFSWDPFEDAYLEFQCLQNLRSISKLMLSSVSLFGVDPPRSIYIGEI
jgi:hypothetical protein